LSPDSPEQIATDLREIARANTVDGVGIKDMQEWRAAQMIETAVDALREIKDGAPEPRVVATVALMEMNDDSPAVSEPDPSRNNRSR
jgi:hypothetical protein